MSKNIFFILAGIALAAGGCKMAPEYTRPTAPVPGEWPGSVALQDAQAQTNAAEASHLKWQACFTDEKLQRLIAAALTNNLDLRLAALNVEQARALYGIQRAELLPTVNAVGSGSKERTPADLSTTGQRQITERYSATIGVFSWEPDFFGRMRSLKDKALDEYLATEQARRGAQLLLVSSVADAYLVLAADRESLNLAQTTLVSQQDAYKLIKRRYDLGLVTQLDLYRVQTQVDTARGDIARFNQRVAQDENALNLLVGSPAAREELPMRLSEVTPPQDIQAGLSSEVLLRRPDVLQAENLLKAANANIGAARAAFFPRISLTAALGTSSADLSGLFKAGSETWNYAPQIVMPIFDARTWSAYKATKVKREMAVTQYGRAIQSAFKEVADTLAVRSTVDQQVEAQESLVHAVAETYRLSNSRYDKGLDSYLSVLDAQRSLYSAQQGLVTLHLAKLANRVQLYAVLGGDELSETQPGK